MSGLAALLAGRTRPGVYLWHNALHEPDVHHAVEHAGWRFAYLDGWTIDDRASFCKQMAAVLDLSADPGDDVDAFAAGLDEVTAGEQRGTVVLWDGWSPLARADQEGFDAVLSAFRRRVDGGSDPFAVVLRGEGPDTTLSELPDAPH